MPPPPQFFSPFHKETNTLNQTCTLNTFNQSKNRAFHLFSGPFNNFPLAIEHFLAFCDEVIKSSCRDSVTICPGISLAYRYFMNITCFKVGNLPEWFIKWRGAIAFKFFYPPEPDSAAF